MTEDKPTIENENENNDLAGGLSDDALDRSNEGTFNSSTFRWE